MLTLAQLKRDAKSKRLEGKMVVWCGKDVDNNLPDRLKGWRRLVDANSVGIFFMNDDGRKSELQIRAASLVEYDGTTLTIYKPAVRGLNEDEQKVVDEWSKITSTDDYKRRSYADVMTDGTSTYWQEKHFFQSRGYLYLMVGQDKERGCRAQYVDGKLMVVDDKIKGVVDIKYILREVV